MLQFAQDLVQRFGLVDEEGQGMIEYVLIAALVSIVAIAVILQLGAPITAVWQSVLDALP